MGRRSRKRAEGATRAERDAARRELALERRGAVSGEDGEERLFAGLVIASLGGGELALREHLAGYRSHSTLLAGVATFVSVTVVALGLGPVKLWILVLVGGGVFAATFYAMRELFKRRSGGLGFR